MINATVANNLAYYTAEQWLGIDNAIRKHLLPDFLLIEEIFQEIVSIVTIYKCNLVRMRPEETGLFSFQQAEKNRKKYLQALKKTKEFFDHFVHREAIKEATGELKKIDSLPFDEFYKVLNRGIESIDAWLKMGKIDERTRIARNILFSDIKRIWEKYTGQKATANSRYNDKDGYSLYEIFARAVAEPILHPLDKEHGLDSPIAESVKNRKKI